jgi:O-antigen/teichoic acid export membrane protein
LTDARPGSDDMGVPVGPLDAGEVRRRAISGAAVLGARGLLVYALAIAANLVLARLLVPRDFGLVALGSVLVVAGVHLGEVGIGAPLIRRAAPPVREELQAVNGLQLALTGLIGVACAGAALPIGRDGWVVALMVASLPVTVLRAPSVIVLERELKYRPIATTDVVEAAAYYLWAVGAVALGFGVWGLASAVVVRAIAGTATMIAVGPLGLLRPRWSWRHTRPLLAFGAKFQATMVVTLVRLQGLNVLVAAVAGVATLGVWNLAWRVLQVPIALFVAAARVAYPAMSRLLGGREDPRAAVERALMTLAVLTGAVTVVLVAFAPALPGLIGEDWGDVPAVLFWSGVALVLSSPVTVATAGYLFAADDPGAVAVAALASTIAWFGVTAALLPALGAPAVGIGWIAGGVVDGVLLGRAAARHSGAAIVRSLAAPTAVALAATGAAWLVADRAGADLLGAALGAAAGAALMLAGCAAICRSALDATRSLLSRGLRGLGRPGGEPA